MVSSAGGLGGEGCPCSPALAEGGLVWTEETVGRLLAFGPDSVTPGTKMPIQRISDAAERAALRASTPAP